MSTPSGIVVLTCIITAGCRLDSQPVVPNVELPHPLASAAPAVAPAVIGASPATCATGNPAVTAVLRATADCVSRMAPKLRAVAMDQWKRCCEAWTIPRPAGQAADECMELLADVLDGPSCMPQAGAAVQLFDPPEVPCGQGAPARAGALAAAIRVVLKNDLSPHVLLRSALVVVDGKLIVAPSVDADDVGPRLPAGELGRFDGTLALGEHRLTVVTGVRRSPTQPSPPGLALVTWHKCITVRANSPQVASIRLVDMPQFRGPWGAWTAAFPSFEVP